MIPAVLLWANTAVGIAKLLAYSRLAPLCNPHGHVLFSYMRRSRVHEMCVRDVYVLVSRYVAGIWS